MTAGDTIVIRESANSRQAVAFDATDDYILADAHAVARVAAGDTVGAYTAWIYIDATSGVYTVLSAGDNNVVEYLSFNILIQGELAGIQFKVQQGGVTKSLVTQTTPSFTKKEWHHIAVVNDLTIKKLYVDGIVVPQTNTTVTDPDAWYDIITGGDKFAIGVLEANATHTQDFPGMISDVKYWNYALTADDILKDYKGETARAEVTATLQSHWDMNGDVTDAGLGADNGTLTGHAYNSGWSSAWSRGVEINSNGHAAERMNTVINGDIHTTVIVKGD